jgi:hypothetical protein
MWHERRPNQQSPVSRTNSPIPRRGTAPTPPPRPGLTPRVSSLSLVSTPAISTTNLSTTLRTTNGSALRHELRNETTPDVPDPLQVLESIIGPPSRKYGGDGAIAASGEGSPDGIDRDVNFSGLSLQDFVDESARDGRSSNVHSLSLPPAECTSFSNWAVHDSNPHAQ